MAPRYHHGDLRAALLDGALEMLRERGVEALSLRELAREIGVSHAAPSRHFKDKRALLDALALKGFQRLSEVMAEAIGRRGAFSTRFRATAAAYVDFAVKDAALLDVMYTNKHAPDVPAELLEAGMRLGEVVLGMIVDGQRAGKVRSGDPTRVSMLILTSLHGFASLRASGMLPAEGADKALDALVSDLARAIRPEA
ncbi:TetR family transcriptional regulator [Herbihabitans rhizosphaerae]|uniref:TetR family transcriptional regulator n=1 Tax=Herbihabitans rhizosphaerae TaxID=1872711 RepID=A0A4Q7KDT0_9PSEU|nr:TetR/AcrR family transcriptional regulator [Herbihabitans rhizosphaerae]RZS31367.1 TetR family transcriptional regulator [Herbihabitans rhizosphaerae]